MSLVVNPIYDPLGLAYPFIQQEFFLVCVKVYIAEMKWFPTIYVTKKKNKEAV